MTGNENRKDETSKNTRVHVNCELQGEPARILLELKGRGLALSNTDAIAQGLLALYDRVIERDLRKMRLGLQEEGKLPQQ